MNTIFFSPTGKTKTVMEAITGSFKTQTFDITYKKNRSQPIKLEKGITFVGVPVYAGRIPKPVLGPLQKLKGQGQPCVIVVTYGNRAYDDALIELYDLMTQSEFKVIAAGAFPCEHSYTKLVAQGRPNEDDFKVYRRFADHIKTLDPDQVILTVPGQRPYCLHNKVGKIGPKVNAQCIQCGQCVEVCPVEAIEMNPFIIADPEKCLKCQACLGVCPVDSISFNGQLDGFVDWLESNCTGYKGNEVFYGQVKS